jgi:hypothetical protein
MNTAVGDINHKEETINGNQFMLKNALGISNYNEDVFDKMEVTSFMNQKNQSTKEIDSLIKNGTLLKKDRFDEQRDLKDRDKDKKAPSSISMDAKYGQSMEFLNKVKSKIESGSFGYYTSRGTMFDQYGNIVDYNPAKDKKKEVSQSEIMERVAVGRENHEIDKKRFATLFQKQKEGNLSLEDLYRMSGAKYPY